MSLTLTLHTQPEVPLEAEAITPERFEGMSTAQIVKLPLLYGNQAAALGDFFRVEGQADGELRIVGECARIKRIGSAMSRGRLIVEGNVGMHMGSGMTGGEIVVDGDAGDWLGAEMRGGRIVVRGSAGHLVGSALRGGRVGVLGGEILVHGNVGNETASGMRRGLIAIGGDAGDFTGVNLLAGTVIVLGKLGWRTGAGMRRGTVVSTQPAELLPTFSYACSYRPVMLRLMLIHLRAQGFPVTGEQIAGRYRRWCGDAIEMNRGEVLLPENA